VLEISHELHTLNYITFLQNMQKSRFLEIFREEVVRGSIFAVTFFSVTILAFGGVAAAANGGLFGDLLNKLLVKSWDDPTNDGTARNAARLGNIDASQYVPLGANRTCGPNQCIYGFDGGGNVRCR
jgi:hypothetical protein